MYEAEEDEEEDEEEEGVYEVRAAEAAVPSGSSGLGCLSPLPEPGLSFYRRQCTCDWVPVRKFPLVTSITFGPGAQGPLFPLPFPPRFTSAFSSPQPWLGLEGPSTLPLFTFRKCGPKVVAPKLLSASPNDGWRGL